MATDTRRELQIVIEAVDNVSKDLKNITNNLGQLDASVKSSSVSTAQMAKSVALGNLAYSAFSTIIMGAVSGVKNFISESITLTGQLRQNQATLLGLAENAGWAKEQVDALISSIREEGKDLLTATEITKTAIVAGLDLAQAQEIVKRGRDAAAASNRNSNEAIRGMIRAIAELKPALVENFNILVSERVAYSEYAKSVGKTTSELSKAERSQALYNEIMKQATMFQGAYEDAMDSWLKKANSVRDLIDELKIIIGTLADGAMKPIIDFTYSALKAFNKWAVDSEGKLNPTLQALRNVITSVLLVIFKLGITISKVVSEVFGPFVKVLYDAGVGSDFLTKYILTTGKVIGVLIKSVGVGIKTFANFGAIMIESGKVAMSVAKDMWNAFKGFFKNMWTGVKAVAKAFTGDFEGAMAELRKTVSLGFDNTKQSFTSFSRISEQLSTDMVNDFNDLGIAVAEIIDPEALEKDMAEMKSITSGFTQSLTNDFDSVQEKIKGMTGETEATTKEMESSWKKFGNSVKKVAESIADKFAESQNKVRDLLKQTSEVNVDYAKNSLSWREDVAKAYVDQEEKVAELRADWQSEQTQTTKDELFKELQAQQEVLNARKHLESAFSNEIAEERRRRSLTDFERQMEDLNKTRTIIEQEYQAKIAQIKTELSAELEKQDKLKQIQERASLDLKKFLLNNEKSTVESINREIEKYNQLAQAISRARSGATSAQLGTGEITRGLATLGMQQQQLAPVNLTITGNQFLDESASEKMGNQLMDILKSNIRM
jgi:chromosome segregation ATPase